MTENKIRQESRSNASNVKLWKFKMADDRHVENGHIAINFSEI